MRAIIEVFLALIFTISLGTSSLHFSSMAFRKEVLLKLQKGLPSIQKFTHKLTRRR